MIAHIDISGGLVLTIYPLCETYGVLLFLGAVVAES
jgi:hypothetical protein